MKHTIKYFILCAFAFGVLPIWAQTETDEMDISPKDKPVAVTPATSGYAFYIGDIYFSEQIPLTTLVGLNETVELRCFYNGILCLVKEFTITNKQQEPDRETRCWETTMVFSKVEELTSILDVTSFKKTDGTFVKRPPQGYVKVTDIIHPPQGKGDV